MTVLMVLPGPAGDSGWVDAATTAAGRVATEVDVVVQELDEVLDLELPDGVTAVLAHGVQLLPWVKRLRAAGDRRPTVLTDLPDDLPEGVIAVDWGWPDGAQLAGALAADLSGGAPVGILAGPPVPTQQRVVAAFRAGAIGTEVIVRHVSRFEATDEARAAARAMVEQGCAVLAHACDAAGESACADVRPLGARTIGFLTGGPEHVAVLHSDVSAVVERLVRDLAGNAPLPPVVRCRLGSPELDLLLSPDMPQEVRERLDALR